VWLGLLLHPAGADAHTIAIRAGLVLADALDAVLGRAAAQLKWPNDVVLDDRKLAGILCEARWQGESLQWLALGVGVNVVNEIPADLRDGAIALRELVPGIGRLALLDRIVPALSRLGTGGARLTAQELAAYAARDWLRGRQLRSPMFGRAAGLRPDGALLVELGAGTAAVREGRVELA
jgi:BirA family biotin operon repressor/biotin-[acetyl-CoA-carboxylase] ligase